MCKLTPKELEEMRLLTTEGLLEHHGCRCCSDWSDRLDRVIVALKNAYDEIDDASARAEKAFGDKK